MLGLIAGGFLAIMSLFGIYSVLSSNNCEKSSTQLKSSIHRPFSAPPPVSKFPTEYQWKNETSEDFTNTSLSVSKLKTEYEWKKITSDLLIGYSKSNESQAMPFDFERTIDGRTFITLLAEENFSISLTTISGKNSEEGPLLAPYPDSSWFSDPRNCSNITSAWSITTDKCNRLWVLDTGHIGNLQMCNPKLLVFNLTNNKLLYKHQIPQEIYSRKLKKSVLINPVVETAGNSCDVKSVYMVDSQEYGLVMWNGTEFRHLPSFQSESPPKHLNIPGTTLYFPGGKVPVVLNPNSHTLFVAPLASTDLLIFTKTKLKKMFDKSPIPLAYLGEMGIFDAQPTSLQFSTDGKVLFIGLVDNSIRCWRVDKELEPENIDTAIIDKKLQFISAIKIYPGKNQDDDEIWILVNNLQKKSSASRNMNEIRSEIIHVSMKDLIKDTFCK